MKRDIDAGMPRTLTIMGQKFTVQVVKNLHIATDDLLTSDVDEEQTHDGVMKVLGVCDRDHQVIALDPNTGFDHFRETFLHEITHGLVAKAGLNHDHLMGGVEEQVVRRLSPILLQFLRDNPRVVEFLTGRRQGGAGSAGA